jgi:hypothetical protein
MHCKSICFGSNGGKQTKYQKLKRVLLSIPGLGGGKADGFGTVKGTDDGNGNSSSGKAGNVQGIIGPKGTEKGTDYYQRDVYELDENIFWAGPYFNVQAVREANTEEEIVVGTAQHPKRKEKGFTLAGDSRILQAKIRYRLDRGMVISYSFDPGNLFCTGCKARGPHSVVGSKGGDGGASGAGIHGPELLCSAV